MRGTGVLSEEQYHIMESYGEVNYHHNANGGTFWTMTTRDGQDEFTFTYSGVPAMYSHIERMMRVKVACIKNNR